jgi:hypothetical protein
MVMTTKRRGKKQIREGQLTFAERSVWVLEGLSAVRDPRPWLGPTAAFLDPKAEGSVCAGHFWIFTRAGWLSITAYGDWIACCFRDPARAGGIVGGIELNRASGKWNHHVFDADPSDVLETFRRRLAELVPPETQPDLVRWEESEPGAWRLLLADEHVGSVRRRDGCFVGETRSVWRIEEFDAGPSLDGAKSEVGRRVFGGSAGRTSNATCTGSGSGSR